jgi:hypothetical protein
MSMTVVRTAFIIMNPQRHHCGGIQNVRILALGNGLVDGRLEPPLIDNEICSGDGGYLPRRQLKIVRLGSGLGKAADVRVGTGDSLCDEFKRVSRRDDLQDLRTGGVWGAARCGAAHQGQRQRDRTKDCSTHPQPLHENDYHL